MPVFYALSIPPECGAADAKALRRTALVVTAFFQYHSDDLPLDEGQRLGEVERGGGRGRRIRVGGRKGKLRLQGGLNVRQPGFVHPCTVPSAVPSRGGTADSSASTDTGAAA